MALTTSGAAEVMRGKLPASKPRGDHPAHFSGTVPSCDGSK